MAVLLIASGCKQRSVGDKTTYLVTDIRLFKGTRAWELAKAIDKQDTEKISNILLKDTSLINFQENHFGFSPLMWAVFNNRLAATTTLLEHGANPNVPCKDGETAFIFSADKYETSDYVRLLLKYSGDINYIDEDTSNVRFKTPLIAAAAARLENVQLLVKAGADVNYVSPKLESALDMACELDNIEIVRYLVIDCKADYKRPIGHRVDGTTMYVIDIVKDSDFSSEPKRNRIKTEVLNYMQMH